MNSFSAEIGSRGYHVYRGTTWRNIHLHEQVGVSKETNEISKEKDPYCCKITITRVDRIGPVTVGHIPRELSRFVFFFLHEGGSVSGTVASLTPNTSPIPEGGLEVPILMHFTHRSKAILDKMSLLVGRQIEKMKEILDEKTLFDDENGAVESDEETLDQNIVVESDDENDNEDKVGVENNQAENDIIVLD